MDFSSSAISASSDLESGTEEAGFEFEAGIDCEMDVCRCRSRPSFGEVGVLDKRRRWVCIDRSIDVCLSIPSLTM